MKAEIFLTYVICGSRLTVHIDGFWQIRYVPWTFTTLLPFEGVCFIR